MTLRQFPRKYSFPRFPLGSSSVGGPFLLHPIPAVPTGHIISGTLSGIYEWEIVDTGIRILQMIPLIPPNMPTGYELTAFGIGGVPFFSGPLSNCFVAQAQGTISQGDIVTDYWADVWAVNTSGVVVFRHYVDTDWYSFSIQDYNGCILYSPPALDGGLACLDPTTREPLWTWHPPTDYIFPGNESSEPAYLGGVNAFDVIRHGPHAGEIIVADAYVPGFYAFHPELGITWAVGGSQAYSYGPDINNVHDFYNPWGMIHTPQDTLILVDNSSGNWREVDWQYNILNYVSLWDVTEEQPAFFPESSVSLNGSSFISAGDSLDMKHGLVLGNWDGAQKYLQVPFEVNRSQLSILDESFLTLPPTPAIHLPDYPV